MLPITIGPDVAADALVAPKAPATTHPDNATRLIARRPSVKNLISSFPSRFRLDCDTPRDAAMHGLLGLYRGALLTGAVRAPSYATP